MAGVPGSDTADGGDTWPAQLPNIPVPDLPALPKGAPPPAPVIGVLGVPEIMRAATAAQQVEKVIGERREKLNEDAQKEQAAWRELQQQLGAQRASLAPDQVRQKERDLQERITNAQNSFRDRNRIIQETAQYCARPDRADTDRGDPAGGGEPGNEPGAAPGTGGAEHQRVRHQRAGDGSK